MDTLTPTRASNTIFVLATDDEGTRYALRRARMMARKTGERLVLLVPIVIPYGVGIRHVDPSDPELERFRALSSGSSTELTVRGCACREPRHVFGHMLLDCVNVVIGGHKGRWRRSAEERLAWTLAHEGHKVTFADVEAK